PKESYSCSTADPFLALEEFVESVCRITEVSSIASLPFDSGILGYIAYECCSYLERIPRSSAAHATNPDIYFSVPRLTWCLERNTDRAWLTVITDDPIDFENDVATLVSRISAAHFSNKTRISAACVTADVDMKEADYTAAINRVHSEIARGNLYQVCL